MELLLLFHSRFFFLPYSLDAISEKVCQYVQYIVWERILNSSIESIVGIVSELFVNQGICPLYYLGCLSPFIQSFVLQKEGQVTFACTYFKSVLPWMLSYPRTTKMLMDSVVRSKITIMPKIEKFSKSFLHILETLNRNYEKRNCDDMFIQLRLMVSQSF